MKRKDVDQFEKLSAQLQGVYDELSILSKKSPVDAVNKFKLGFVNTLLQEANGLLDVKHRPFKEFEVFNVDDVPLNSDVVFILAQYLQCLEKWRTDNLENRMGYWYWVVKGEKGEGDENGNIYIRTTRPDRVKEK